MTVTSVTESVPWRSRCRGGVGVAKEFDGVFLEETIRRQLGANQETIAPGDNQETIRRQSGDNQETIRRQLGENQETIRRQSGDN